MAAKFFTGLPLDGPDPECVHGHGEAALAARDDRPRVGPRPLEGRPGRRAVAGAHARPLSLAGAHLRSWSSPVPPGPRWRRPGGGASWRCRSDRSNSTGPTSRSTPTRGSRWRWRRGSRPAVGASRWRRAVAYGASGEHAGFPGTLLVGHEVLGRLLVELVRSARRSFAGVVLVSAHGGNEDALAAASRRCAADGDDVLVWRAVTPGGDAHAGRTETSLMLALDPGAVRSELAEPGCTEPLGTHAASPARRRGAAGIVQRRAG